MMILQSLFIPLIFMFLFDLISCDEMFRASLTYQCKLMYSSLCRKIDFILSCISLTLAPEKLFTLTRR